MADTTPQILTLDLASPGAATAVTDSFVIGEAPYAATVTAVTFTPDTAITGANTNSRTLTVVNGGQAGAGTTVIATIAFTAGVNGVAFDEAALTLSVVTGATTLVAGDIIKLTSTAVGTGIADPGGLVQVTISRD